MELCERYSEKVMNERTNGTILTDVAPKDVKQLEVLRPHSAPSMGQRFKQSLEKENRLEVASKPIQSKSSISASSTSCKKEDSKEKGSKTSKKKKKKNRRKSEVDEALEQGNTSTDQADEVEEGINWSDEE